MKLLRALAVAAVVAVSLAGCAAGGVGAGGSSAKLDPDAKVSGSITVWSWDTAATALKRLGASYQKSHPGTTIKVIDVGYDNAYDKISVGLQAGSGLPDVLTIETDHMPGYVTQFPKGFVDLRPVAADLKSDFDPSKWAANIGKDGAVYALPWDSGTIGLFYRSDYLKQAGVDPSSLTSWNDMLEVGKRIKAATGHTLFTMDLSTGGYFQTLLQQQGQGIFNAKGQITVSDGAAVKTLTMLQQMYKAGLINNVKGWDAEVSAAKNGNSAMDVNAVWWIGTLTSEMPELSGKFGVTELPEFSGSDVRTSNNGGSNLAVTSQSKNPQLAAAFVKYALADKSNQVSMMKQEGIFPSYLPALKDPLFAEPSPYFGGQKVYQLFAQQTANIPPVVYRSDNPAAATIVDNAVVASVVNGQDPKSALEAAAKQIATATKRTIAG